MNTEQYNKLMGMLYDVGNLLEDLGFVYEAGSIDNIANLVAETRENTKSSA